MRSSRKSMSTSWVWPAAVAVSAMYFLDPPSGRRRRARARQFVGHTVHDAVHGLERATRDAQHRIQGALPRARSGATPANERDEVVVARVRSRLGHACSHPHAIQVSSHDGIVELMGPILEAEAPAVLRLARATRGVSQIVDQLERHARPGSIAALQGAARTSRRERGYWPPAARLAVGGAGAFAALFGLARGGIAGVGAAVLGGVAVARSLANVPLAELGGVRSQRPGIDIEKSITVHAPVQDVLELFTKPENFPRFMRHVKEVVRLADNRWRWKVVGPGGSAYEWECAIERLVPNELVAWKSAEGASVANEGSVAFETIAPGVTRLTIRLRYWPPGGLVGHEIARLLGDDPKRELDEDMLRLKSLVEFGRTTGPEGSVSLDEIRASPER